MEGLPLVYEFDKSLTLILLVTTLLTVTGVTMRLLALALILFLTSACGKLDTQKSEPGPQGPPGSTGAQGPTGIPGQNAQLSSGPIGSMLPNGLSACHHDYEFQVNHWLIVRHQKNGTSDQGAGSTGFDLWNVDIMDSILVSEAGNVTYCTLHFDNAALTLKYTVIDAQDGKQGESGTINLTTGQVL